MRSRLVLLGCLAACRHAPAPSDTSRLEPQHPVATGDVAIQAPGAPVLERNAAIEGRLLDAKTLTAVTGVIVAATRQESGEDFVGTSDENGRFRVEVPAGTYRGTVYLYDTTLALREVSVEAHEVTRWDVEVDHALVMSDRDQDHTPRCPDIVGEAEVSPVEIDKVLASALEHVVAGDSTLPASRSKVFVEAEIGVRCATDLHCSLDAHVNAGAMPRNGLRTYVVKSREDLQALADRTRKDVEHVRFSQVDIVGHCATVEVGLSVMTPTGTWDHVPRCRHIDLYEKRDGNWRFKLGAKQTCD